MAMWRKGVSFLFILLVFLCSYVWITVKNTCNLVKVAREGIRSRTRGELAVDDKEGDVLVHLTRSPASWSGERDTTCLWKTLNLSCKNSRKRGKPCVLILGTNAIHILHLRERTDWSESGDGDWLTPMDQNDLHFQSICPAAPHNDAQSLVSGAHCPDFPLHSKNIN